MANRNSFYGAAALMLAALILGGGGNSAPLHNLLIQLLAIFVLAMVAWQNRLTPSGKAEACGIGLLVLILLTPILHLVPIPYSLWSELPGRDHAVEVANLVGTSGEWRPLSLDPEATALSGAFLLAPAAMFLTVLRLDEDHRRQLAKIIIAAAILSLVLGGLQIAAGGQLFRIYSGSHDHLPTGLFINRNHQADLLLIALLLSAALPSRDARRNDWVWIWLSAVVLFSVGVIATASRTGFVLLMLALLGSLKFSSLPGLRKRGGTMFWAAIAALIAFAVVAQSAGTGRLLSRFQTLSDGRSDFWPDAVAAAEQYFPFGSGLGTFDPVFRAIEDLNRVGPKYANHAHNDYLELLIETGLWGCLLLSLFIVLAGWLATRRGIDRSGALRKAASFAITIILIHSIVDYPLRMLSLLTVFGFLCALLFPAPQRHGPAVKAEPDGI